MLITLEKHKIWKNSAMKHMEEYKCLPKVEVMRKNAVDGCTFTEPTLALDENQASNMSRDILGDSQILHYHA